MNELIIIWSTGTLVTFVMLSMGVKLIQQEDYDNAPHEDKELILFARYKDSILYLTYMIASFFWFISLPSVLLYLTILKKESD